MSSDMTQSAHGALDDHISPKLKNELPSDDVPLSELCKVLYTRLQAFLDSTQETQLLKDVQEQVRIGLKVSEDALNTYKLDQLALSYNGGKDCLVLLIIYLAALHIHFERPLSTSSTNAANHASSFPTTIETIYIQHEHSFYQVDDFVRSSSRQFHLSMTSSIKPMKEAFTGYLEENPNIKAIFVGTRRTDPHGAKLTHFDQTDGGWPSFMRIHPVIDWHYQEIWAFIRHFEIPYCSLYDAGYTSLGGTQDTLPNPKLCKPNSDGKLFRPAYELMDDGEERLGRDIVK